MKSPRNFFFFHLWKSFHFVAHRMMLTPGFSGWKIQKETENYVSYLKEFKRANLGYFILANNSWSILYSRLQIDLWTKWTIIENWIRKVKKGDFPGGTVIRNSPSNAGDMGSIPGQGTKIPHAAGQLSLCTTTELACLNDRARMPQTTEPMYPAWYALWSLHTTMKRRWASTKIPRAATKTRHSQKNK